MRRLVQALLAAIAILVAANVYLARELSHERERIAKGAVTAPAPPHPAGASSPNVASVTAGAPAKRAEAADPAKAAAAPSDESKSRQPVALDAGRAAAAARGKELLAQLEDPVKRTELLRQRELSMRSFHLETAQQLHLNAADSERFVGLMLRQQLASEEAMARCALDETCPYPNLGQEFWESQAREVAAEFGDETQQAWSFYMRSLVEREIVRELRARLPDRDRLTDPQADRLIRVLVEENERIRADALRRGDRVGQSQFSTYVPQAGGNDAPGREQAFEYNRALRDRAASVLSSGQMSVYEQMQQEVLRSFGSTSGDN